MSEQRAAEGFYTLAIAVRNLGQYNSRLEQDLAAWTRDEVEYNLSFLTLLLFRNNIKDDTAEAITKLKKGGIRPIMITGDNALTAMYIAKEGNLVSKSAAMIYGQLVKESKHGTRGSGGASEEASKPARTSEVNESVLNPTAQQQAHTSPLLLDDEAAAVLPLASDYGAVASSSGHFLRQQTSSMIEMKNVHEDLSEGLDLGDVVWTDMRDGTCLELDSVLSSVAEMNSVKDEVESSALELSFRRDIEVVVTGAVFEILQKRYPEVLHRLLLHIRIFARMTPMAKVDCVQLHMARGITAMCGDGGITAMCGDGGNDCGALRTAHVGIAMSNAEASIVSPFSTADRSVHSVIEMLKEGRAAVATSFSLYRYLIICGEAIIFAKLCYAYFSVALSQWTYIVIDSFLALGFVYTLSQAKPSAALWPRRPTAKLLGPETALSCTAVVLTNAAFLFMGVAWLFSQPWFVCHEFDARTTPDILKWWLLADNFEGELLGFLVLFQCCTAALIGAFGYQYRESWYKNWQFVSVFTVFCLLFSYMMLGNPSRLGCWFRFQCGDPDKLVDLGYFTNSSQIVWPIPAYNTPLHHNVMPASFRAKMFFYALTNSLLVIVGYRYFVLGRGREMIRRLALLPNAFGTGAPECSITAYRGGLSYTLAGQPLDTKGALPGTWRRSSYRPSGLACFAAHSRQVLRTSAEQHEVESLAWAPDMCQCFASERRCTEWLQRWWERPGSERFELVVDGRASWTGLQCVDAQQHTDQGRAQLFALSVHLGPAPAPPANAEADDGEEVEEIEPEPLDGEE
eukprot:g24545.t1